MGQKIYLGLDCLSRRTNHYMGHSTPPTDNQTPQDPSMNLKDRSGLTNQSKDSLQTLIGHDISICLLPYHSNIWLGGLGTVTLHTHA